MDCSHFTYIDELQAKCHPLGAAGTELGISISALLCLSTPTSLWGLIDLWWKWKKAWPRSYYGSKAIV